MLKQEYSNVWIYIDTRKKCIDEYDINMLAKGRTLADEVHDQLCAVVVGNDVQKYGDELKKYDIDVLYICETSKETAHDYNIYADMIEGLISEYRPNIFIFPSTIMGRSVSSRVAAKVRTGLTADCTELRYYDAERKLIDQTRPALEGNVMADIITENSRPQMVTVGRNIGSDLIGTAKKEPQIIYKDHSGETAKSVLELISELPETETDDALENISVIVAGGRGVKTREDFRLLEELACLLGGKLAVTRAIVDKGWYGEEIMVGQTGKKVSSEVYIAFGISGALQHIVGIDSKTVVAVNIDKDAMIFQRANYGIVADCMEVCKSMIKQLKEQ